MNQPFNDEKLAAYALGELDEAERDAITAFLQTDETARRTVAEFRVAAQWAAEVLTFESAEALSDEQRQSILTQAKASSEAPLLLGASETPKPASRRWYRDWRKGLALAAVLCLVSGIGVLILSQPNGEISPFLYSQDGDGIDSSATPSENVEAYFATSEESARLGVPSAQNVSGGGGGMSGGGMGGYGGGMGGFGVLRQPSTVIQDFFSIAPDLNGKPAETIAFYAKEPLPKTDSTAAPPSESLARYLIKNGAITLETEDVAAACTKIIQSVTAAGGYVSSQQEQTDGLGHHFASLQVRVPADLFDRTIQEFAAAWRVLHKQVTTDDVTEEYVDTEARTRNLKKTEERLLDHLSKAILIESTLKIETELTRVREQLERLEGRLRYLDHRVRYSTLDIKLQEKPKTESLIPVQTFSSGKVFSEALRSLIALVRTLWTKIIWIAVWTPVWGILGFIGWRLVRRLRRALQ